GSIRHDQSSKKAEAEMTQESSSKRAGDELEQKEKKQKIDDDQEEAEMKKLIEGVSDEEEVAIDAIPLATKPPSIVDWKNFSVAGTKVTTADRVTTVKRLQLLKDKD
ncbi:hypothetical protein Tco_1001572, partial [Tanacetum coccineum]